ncbi:MAG: malic enzyme-like NAD(P)-binding protein [Sedimentibacter saalensis]|jgi:malate dehydrogenase (oxaloacetate-decarboxylating)|uniref:Malate dehydrogenase (Oxaloacetate-decarboxylating) n=1 Tax=Sedimentibacter saalensis TaxID=130788 RepID=A0A562J761_9FIRM|nr:malic enzyme-like NAD(P)-binding protein [Sedimentibacter saalensis]MEA5093757.1 malic enzyme-like NAD(P)-binding protein [Sedimentibacter saalensis]TWH79022.1 malate dehydrogenase (oxaloacetate-decarboxylating) [Sedimentibacter saalensis]
MNYNEEALKMHEAFKGKIEIKSKVRLENRDDLSTAYTPGVAEPCRKIHENTEDVYRYTAKGNLVAVLSDGSAVLGLGNIGAEAAIPVMEGKAVLFKSFAGVDAFPICVKSQDIEEIINTAVNIAPVFGGINLEDIQAPKCFEIEERLKKILDIPVFHDDQHGTAIVVSAALINALKLTKKNMEEVKIVLNGPGAAGTAIIKMLISLGAKNIVACDSKGIVVEGRDGGLNAHKTELSKITNSQKLKGTLKDAMVGADVFIGVSAPNSVTEEMVKNMNSDSIIFAMANPTPEIMPDIAKKAGARVVGTGRSDFPNQINNVLAFPGVFRGALDCRAKQITEEMKKAAAYAIANLVTDEQLAEDFIIPGPFNNRVAMAVAAAVAEAWEKESK